MNIKELKELIDKVCETGIAEIEVSSIFGKVVIRRLPLGNPSIFSPYQPLLTPLPVSQTQQISSKEISESLGVEDKVDELEGPTQEKLTSMETRIEEKVENIAHITAPMVGTFYRAPAPGAEPYVKEGDKIKKGTVVCIIEAMKLMNEIESEYNGIVKEIHCENGKPVEYGQVLFTILVD
ncbi:MAG: acetyl-CoA carboxylase biotin carboxyl carrier protein [bacterium]